MDRRRRYWQRKAFGALMSALSHHLTSGNRMLRTASGNTVVEWRTGDSGSWTEIDALFRNDGVQPVWDKDMESEVLMETGHIEVDVDQVVLDDGYQVRIAEDDEQTWAVNGGPTGSGHRHYDLRRKVSAPGDQAGPDRGRR